MQEEWNPNRDPSPWARCADGFEISIQANELLYCSPRENRGDFEGDYSAVEIACNPQPELEWREREGTLSTGESVYAYVPVEVVNSILRRHGGVIKNGEYLPPGVKPRYSEGWHAERWEVLLGQPL